MGYSEKTALVFVGISFLILYFTHFLLIFFVAKVIALHGTKLSLLVSQVFFLIFLLTYNHVKNVPLLILSFTIWGVAAAFWWTAYHTYFVEVGNKKEFGKEVSVAEILGVTSGLLAPVLAGLLLNYFDSSFLFLLAFGIISLSVICIILLKDFEQLDFVDIKDFVAEAFKRKREFVAFVGVRYRNKTVW